MHAPAILHRCLEPLLVPIHRALLAALFAAVTACVLGPRLTLTDIARRLPGAGAVRYKLKRIDRLAALLPPGLAPIIVADAGFRVPFYRAVERLGWRWVGRVRGRDFVRPGKRWASCKTVFRQATTTARVLGMGEWVRSNPLQALFVLVKQPSRGRRATTAAGKRARSNKASKAARSAKELAVLNQIMQPA